MMISLKKIRFSCEIQFQVTSMLIFQVELHRNETVNANVIDCKSCNFK